MLFVSKNFVANARSLDTLDIDSEDILNID